MAFQIIRNDITKVQADAIVNTANPWPVVGSGTDSAIYAAAGEEALLAERRKIGDIPRGEAACTPAFALKAKYIIHTVGPQWVDGQQGEREVLRSCYEKSLALGAKLGCESIAFPLISSGVYGFPKDEALNIALSEIGKFLLTHEMQVILVVFSRTALTLSQQIMDGIEELIDDQTARQLSETEYRSGRMSLSRWDMERAHHVRGQCFPNQPAASPLTGFLSATSLDDAMTRSGETFQQRLFRLIDERGLEDVAVYKKANIDRKVFSSIRCKPNYKPKKKTAVAFAIALELDLPETLDLLGRAGMTFSPSDPFDLIVSWFITHRNYDIYEINSALFRYGQPTLGAEQ